MSPFSLTDLLYSSDLVVASPVEDYFLYIDDLPPSQKVCTCFVFRVIAAMETLGHIDEYDFIFRKKLRRRQNLSSMLLARTILFHAKVLHCFYTC